MPQTRAERRVALKPKVTHRLTIPSAAATLGTAAGRGVLIHTASDFPERSVNNPDDPVLQQKLVIRMTTKAARRLPDRHTRHRREELLEAFLAPYSRSP